jgi:hypothetical protein
MRELFFFDAMLTPKIITLVYWLALVGVVVGGLGMMFTGGGFGGFIGGLLMIVFGAVAARIWCEILIVMFKIHENIRSFAERQP